MALVLRRGLVSFGLRLTVSNCLRIWPESVLDQPVSTLEKVLAFSLDKIRERRLRSVYHETDHGKISLLNGSDFQPCFRPLRSVWPVRPLGDDAFPAQPGSVIERFPPIAGVRNSGPTVLHCFPEKVGLLALVCGLFQRSPSSHSRSKA